MRARELGLAGGSAGLGRVPAHAQLAAASVLAVGDPGAALAANPGERELGVLHVGDDDALLVGGERGGRRKVKRLRGLGVEVEKKKMACDFLKKKKKVTVLFRALPGLDLLPPPKSIISFLLHSIAHWNWTGKTA